MRYSILLILFLFSFNFVQSQLTDSLKVFNNEIGVNATELFDQLILTTEENSFITNEFFLYYKRHYPKFSIRSRVGASSSSSQRSGSYYGNSANYKTENFRFNFSAGLEKYISAKGKWRYNYGLEGIVLYDHRLYTNSSSQNGIPERTFNDLRVGGGLICGIHYSIKPWLSVGNELSLRFLSRTDKVEVIYEDSDLNEFGTDKGFEIDFIPINGLFLAVHF